MEVLQFTLLSAGVGGLSASEKRASTDASGASFPVTNNVVSTAYRPASSVPLK